MQLHFHVDLHDVGYHPDADGVVTHLTIDGALDDATTRAEDLIEALSQLDPTEVIRGQQYVESPVTNADEIASLDTQINDILNSISTDEEYNASIARKGLLIVVDDGIAVIELTPCAEESCDIYRKDWVD